MRARRRPKLRKRRATLVLATYCLTFQGCSACFPHEGQSSGCFAFQPVTCGPTRFGAAGGFSSGNGASFPTGDQGSTNSGFPTPTLKLTIGPPSFVYADSPKGVAIHVDRGPIVTGPVTITVQAPANSVAAPTLVLDNATSDAILTVTTVPGTSVGIVGVTVHASNMEVANDATAPLDAVIAAAPGSLDGTFAGTGYIRFPESAAGTGNANGVLVDARGNVAMVGDQGAVPAKTTVLAEFAASGAAIAGSPANIPWSGDNAAFGLAVDKSGRILCGGYAPLAGAGVPTVYRFLQPGAALDPAFGNGGIAQHLPNGQTAGATRALAIVPDGRIAAVGAAGDGVTNNVATLTLFGPDGQSPVDHALPAPAIEAGGLAFDPDMQHVVVVGDTPAPNAGIFLTRFDLAAGMFGFPAGAADHAVFSQPGAMFARGNALAVRIDGNGNAIGYVVAGGVGGGAATSQMTVAAFNLSGALDTSFGGGAGFTTPLPPPSLAQGMTTDGAGRWIVVGQSGSPSTPTIVRLAVTGLPDGTAFDTSPFGGGSANAVAIDSYDRIVIAGTANVAGVPHAFVARYWP